MDKKVALNQAVDLTKEYCRGGGQLHPEGVLERLYKTLLELRKDAEQ